jgi:hypothetical protein
MKHEDDLKKLLNAVTFDEQINPVHRERLKNAVLHTHMSPAYRPKKMWLNAAAIVFAVGLGFIISMQILQQKKTHDVQEVETPVASVAPAPAQLLPETPQQAPLPMWSKENWKKRLTEVQVSQRPARKIIWISPTQKPIIGDEQ